MKKLLLSAAFVFVLGCALMMPEPEYPKSDAKTSAVLVVIESSYIGNNIGAAADLKLMSNVVSKVTDDIVILRNSMATKHNVSQAIMRACSNDLSIVFFTCHGGREPAWNDPFELKGCDGFLFLADDAISSHELFELFKTSTNRVFTIFNCCHAETMYASRADLANIGPNPAFNLLSWGACSEKSDAVTTRKGSLFVSSISRAYDAFDGDLSYGEFWTVIRNSRDVKQFQKPVFRYIGDYKKFDDVKVFK